SAASRGLATRAPRALSPDRSLFSNNYGRCPELALWFRAGRSLAVAVFLAGLRLRRLAGALAAVRHAAVELALAARRGHRVRLHRVLVRVIAGADRNGEDDQRAEGAEPALCTRRQ